MILQMVGTGNGGNNVRAASGTLADVNVTLSGFVMKVEEA